MSMTPEEMCRSCRHEAYCMAAYQKDHWCGNHTGKKDIGDRSASLRNGLKGLETELQELHI